MESHCRTAGCTAGCGEPTETKGRCVLWQPMDTSSVLYTAREEEHLWATRVCARVFARGHTGEEGTAKEAERKSARMEGRRESESKCWLEGGSRWSDWSSALRSVGYLGAVQPLLGATPVWRGGIDVAACLPGCLDHLQCLRPGYLVCSRGHTAHRCALTEPPERVHRIFNAGGH